MDTSGGKHWDFKRSGDMIACYEVDMTFAEKGIGNNYHSRDARVSIDIRTVRSKAILNERWTETRRILEVNRQNPDTDWRRMNLAQRKLLSNKQYGLFRYVQDVILKDFYEAKQDS